MKINQVQHLPIVDKNEIKAFVVAQAADDMEEKLADFVIMAGGEGKRLRPFTRNCPKPMLKIQENLY